MVDPGHKSNLFRLVAKLLTEIDIKDVVVECLEIEFGDMVFIQLLYYVNVSFWCNWCHLYGHIEAYYSKEFICQIWKKKEETDYVKKTSINSQNTENMKNPKFGLTEGQGNQVDGVVKKWVTIGNRGEGGKNKKPKVIGVKGDSLQALGRNTKQVQNSKSTQILDELDKTLVSSTQTMPSLAAMILVN